ncbi:MAG: hypothetical protein IKK66_03085 [Ruminococcus sp.]|nr:hypothetical protein [Ruminococcus sp.]
MTIFTKIVIISAFLFVAAPLTKETLQLVTDLLLAKKFGHYVKSISIFGYAFENTDGKWKYTAYSKSIFIQHYVVIDISDYVPKNIGEKAKILNFIKCLVLFASSGLTIYLFRDIIEKIGNSQLSMPEFCALAFIIGFVSQSIISFGIFIYVNYFVMKKFGGYIQNLIDRIREHASFEDLEMKPIEQLPYKNTKKTERIIYLQLYLMYLFNNDMNEEAKEPITEIHNYLKEKEFIFDLTLCYFHLIYYYSEIEFNQEFACYFAEKIGENLFNDNTSNAKRVVAYYLYNIKKDNEGAKRKIDEGLSLLYNGKLSYAEQQIEHKLLHRLNDRIKQENLNTLLGR